MCFGGGNKSRSGSRNQASKYATVNGNQIEVPPVPQYYSELDKIVVETPSLASTMNYSTRPMTKSMMKQIDKSSESFSIKVYRKVLEYAGDAIGKLQPGNSKIANELIEFVLSPKNLFIYAPDEAMLYCVKQFTNCPESKQTHYINLMIAVFTFVFPKDKSVRTFIKQFIATQLQDPKLDKYKCKFDYLAMTQTTANVFCSYSYDIDSTEWAIKHIEVGSFFHQPLDKQIEYQKGKYSSHICPWGLIQTIHAINQTHDVDMNTIMREATDSANVTNLRYSLDNFKPITLENSNPRVFMSLLLDYIKYSSIIPPETAARLIEIANNADLTTQNEDVVTEIKNLPALNFTTLRYVVKIFKEKFLANSTVKSLNSTMTLLSAVFFRTSNLSTLENPLARMTQVTKTFRIIYENLDVEDVEVME